MTWTPLRGALYAQGATTYRILPMYAGQWFLLDAWCTHYGGWAMLATSGSLEEVQLFAQCEEVFYEPNATR